MKSKKKSLQKIKTGFFERGLSLARITLQTGAEYATNKVGSLLVDDEEKNKKWLVFLKKQTESLSHELGQLKGSAMKAGQMISMYGEHFLPPEANEALKKLYSQSPPLEWNEIEKIIQKNLSPEKINQLEIDPIPIGSASLGQVHKALIKKTNQWIVLKIQYPGVDKAIDSDLKTIRTFLSMMNLIPKGYDLNALFSEIKDMMVQEMDYQFEITQTKQYGDLLKNDNRFVVPTVFEEFSSDKIIATSFESGLSADSQAVQNLSQERRNKLAGNFLDLYATEFYNWGLVQTDPHLGNYRVRIQPDGNDQLVLLDFGAVRKYDPDFLATYKKMITSSLNNNDQGIEEATLSLKFIHTGTSEKIKKDFVDFCKLTVEPFRGGVYDFKKSNLPQRLTKNIYQLVRSFELSPPPKEVLFLDRKTGGVFIFLVVLNAKFDPKPILQKYIPYN